MAKQEPDFHVINPVDRDPTDLDISETEVRLIITIPAINVILETKFYTDLETEFTNTMITRTLEASYQNMAAEWGAGKLVIANINSGDPNRIWYGLKKIGAAIGSMGSYPQFRQIRYTEFAVEAQYQDIRQHYFAFKSEINISADCEQTRPLTFGSVEKAIHNLGLRTITDSALAVIREMESLWNNNLYNVFQSVRHFLSPLETRHSRQDVRLILVPGQDELLINMIGLIANYDLMETQLVSYVDGAKFQFIQEQWELVPHWKWSNGKTTSEDAVSRIRLILRLTENFCQSKLGKLQLKSHESDCNTLEPDQELL